jgi:hypothetical protein
VGKFQFIFDALGGKDQRSMFRDRGAFSNDRHFVDMRGYVWICVDMRGPDESYVDIGRAKNTGTLCSKTPNFRFHFTTKLDAKTSKGGPENVQKVTSTVYSINLHSHTSNFFLPAWT